MFIEIKSHEGGDDSKLFVAELANIYIKLLDKKGWLYSAKNPDLHTGENYFIIELKNKKDYQDFLNNETGIQKIQRDSKNKIHTSTVIVSAYEKQNTNIVINDKDLHVEYFSGTGNGGQNRNKVQNSVRLTHLPTGIKKIAQTRSRETSLKEAKEGLLIELKKQLNDRNYIEKMNIRKNQLELRRIWYFQRDIIEDKNSKSISCKDGMKGKLDKLWI